MEAATDGMGLSGKVLRADDLEIRPAEFTALATAGRCPSRYESSSC
jgi:hypothetical protein